MYDLLLGTIAMASLVVGLFFFKIWTSTHDRFFLFFALSFWIESINRIFLALIKPSSEDSPIFYLIRLLAFSLILIAIIDKNRPQQRSSR